MIASPPLNRRTLLLLLIGLPLGAVGTALLCFAAMYVFGSLLTYFLFVDHRWLVPAWMRLDDISWSYAIVLVPVYAAIVSLVAGIISLVLCGLFPKSIQQPQFSAFYLLTFMTADLGLRAYGFVQTNYMVLAPNFRLGFFEICFVTSGVAWSVIWWLILARAGKSTEVGT